MTRRSILLVEDNPDDELLTLRALEKSRISNRVEIARDGAEALEVLFDRAEEGRLPSLVLLDLKLPKIDGLEVLRRLRADSRTATVRVVIFTTSREERDIVSSYNLGANSFVRKPLDFHDFAEAVRQLGMYWLLLNEPYPP
jgi:two-component system response regulator